VDTGKTGILIRVTKRKTAAIITSAFILLLLSLFFWMEAGVEEGLFSTHNFVYRSNQVYRVFKAITDYGMSLIAFIYTLLLVLSLYRPELNPNLKLFVYVLFCFAFAGISGDLLKELIGRARPAEILCDRILGIPLSNSPSFPSGHTIKAMAMALPFVIFGSSRHLTNLSAKLILLLAGLSVAYSRIALWRHYLSDVLGGIAIALVFTAVMPYIVNRFYINRKMNEEKLLLLSKRLVFVFTGLTILLFFMG